MSEFTGSTEPMGEGVRPRAADSGSVGVVGELWLHPIKSCAPRSVIQAQVDARGLVGDRRWMWVDRSGRFLSQRSAPELARVIASPYPGGLWLSLRDAAAAEVLAVATPSVGSPGVGCPRTVEVWGTSCGALDAGDPASQWLAAALGMDARLVYQHGHRPTDPRFAPGYEVSFADGFPLLITTAAAIQEIATRTARSPDSRRFRPNIVVADAAAFAEERWRRLRMGEVEIELVKPCGRCSVLDVDPDTGKRDVGLLASLGPDRHIGGELRFGMNGVITRTGMIRVGDPIELLSP